MRHSLALLAFTSGAALAETQLPFFWPGFDNDVSGAQPVASVISADPTTTVLQFSCPTNVDETECGWGDGQITYTILSTTIYRADIATDTLRVSFGCTYDSSATQLACEESIVDPELTQIQSGSEMSTRTTLTGTDVAFQTATVTAGESLLGASAGAVASSGASAPASSLATSARASGSAAATTGGTPSASGASATGSGAAAQSTGAAARFGVEGAAMFALAGAAAMVL
ncbi:hypothetical protein BU26DRAFT_281687 [Trematosphaeria pertusa]|uniref:Uncharacterized protein n=1 Tax=Trematosphaeria pertusa TaxID=390896 RepID=A0A6A6IMB2_9PLEO|nr:uncharacterized protein BU26DRAFT_281687 [Trematosphaeria pertusa]KAF2251369.1 hypothetical protein BU26DRAFT_281687 [Trematosphaeria pertusa]